MFLNSIGRACLKDCIRFVIAIKTFLVKSTAAYDSKHFKIISLFSNVVYMPQNLNPRSAIDSNICLPPLSLCPIRNIQSAPCDFNEQNMPQTICHETELLCMKCIFAFRQKFLVPPNLISCRWITFLVPWRKPNHPTMDRLKDTDFPKSDKVSTTISLIANAVKLLIGRRRNCPNVKLKRANVRKFQR